MVTFQTFAPTAKTLNATYFSSINATAASADLPGFRLRVRLAVVTCILSTKPLQLGPLTKDRGEEFGWDCDPLIPISVWVSVLVSYPSCRTFKFGSTYVDIISYFRSHFSWPQS